MAYGIFYLSLILVLLGAGALLAFGALWLVYRSDGGRLGFAEWARRMMV